MSHHKFESYQDYIFKKNKKNRERRGRDGRRDAGREGKGEGENDVQIHSNNSASGIDEQPSLGSLPTTLHSITSLENKAVLCTGCNNSEQRKAASSISSQFV